MPKPLIIAQRMFTAEVGVIPAWQVGLLLAGLAAAVGVWIASRRQGAGIAADRAWRGYGLCIGVATPWLLAGLWHHMAVSADDYRLELRLWALGASVALRCLLGPALPTSLRRRARLGHDLLHAGLLVAVLVSLGRGVYHTGAVAVGGFLILALVATLADLLRVCSGPAGAPLPDPPAEPPPEPASGAARGVARWLWPQAVAAQIALLATLLIGRLLLA